MTAYRTSFLSAVFDRSLSQSILGVQSWTSKPCLFQHHSMGAIGLSLCMTHRSVPETTVASIVDASPSSNGSRWKHWAACLCFPLILRELFCLRSDTDENLQCKQSGAGAAMNVGLIAAHAAARYLPSQTTAKRTKQTEIIHCTNAYHA